VVSRVPSPCFLFSSLPLMSVWTFAAYRAEFRDREQKRGPGRNRRDVTRLSLDLESTEALGLEDEIKAGL